MAKRILVIASHPDDEVLGCGGTIALHSRAGDQVECVIVCEGESLRYGVNGVDQKSHIEEASNTLGIKHVECLGLPDQRLDTLSLVDVITPIEHVVRSVRPHIVYCQYGGDVNRDHQLLFKALLVATRPTEYYIEAVYAFDTASSTEWGVPRTFVPDTWVDISVTLETKLAAMACYKSEVRPYPHPRSLEALRHRAMNWGAQSCLQAAEVFMTIRRIYRHDEALS
jgi:LmbE family N-acetylglucosaminyl deacetylase